MKVVLLYGIRLDGENNADELHRRLGKNDWLGVFLSPSNRLELIHLFGGSNNDGGLFAGIRIKTFDEAYGVGHVTLSEISASATPAAHLQTLVDDWWASDEGDAIRSIVGIGRADPLELMLVFDSD